MHYVHFAFVNQGDSNKITSDKVKGSFKTLYAVIRDAILTF